MSHMNSPLSSQDDRLIDFKETAHLLGDISERSVRRLMREENSRLR
jgi:hypothetical protein